MAISEQVKIEEVKETKPTEEFDFGFDAEYEEQKGYTTISGNEQRDVSNATGYYLSDLEIGNIITGYPEVTIFQNNDKNDAGEFIKKYQNVRVRVIDHDEYIDLYANIPRADENGFIKGLNKYFDFFRTGWDLCFSFMRMISEANVVDKNGEEINKINSINIENVCKKIDSMNYIKCKVVKGANEDYDSWIILDLQNIE